jgi:hypothetical protein
MLLKDPAKFYDEKVLGNRKPIATSTQNIFAEGSLAHSMILEPHLVDEEFKIFPGFRKQGKEWEAFMDDPANAKYTILSRAQKARVSKWVEAYNKLPAAVNLIKDGFAEKTLFGDLKGVPVKVRADYINIEQGFVADVKTTAGPTDVDGFKDTVAGFSYDLSAALYTLMFEQHYGKPFDFYFIVLGKRDFSCEVYKLSEESMAKGREQVRIALGVYKKCIESGIWEAPKLGSKKDLNVDNYKILEV